MFAAFYAAGLALGAPPMLLGLTPAFSSSLMMSLTHYGTGTAPIIFGSGYTTLGEWWKTGLVMSIVNRLSGLSPAACGGNSSDTGNRLTGIIFLRVFFAELRIIA